MTQEDRIATARELLQHARAREAKYEKELAVAAAEHDAVGERLCHHLLSNNRRFMQRIESDLKKLES